LRDRDLSELAAVDSFGVVAQGGVSPSAYVAQDAGDYLLGREWLAKDALDALLELGRGRHLIKRHAAQDRAARFCHLGVDAQLHGPGRRMGGIVLASRPPRQSLQMRNGIFEPVVGAAAILE
jgi:hypothetical protein